MIGVYRATPPTLGDNQQEVPQLDSRGRAEVRAVGYADSIAATPTLSVAGAYASGDYVGKSATPETVDSVARLAGGTTILQDVILVDKAAQGAALELWLLDTTFTAPTDNAAWAISDAEALTVVAVIPIATSDYYSTSNNKVAHVRNVGAVLKCAAGSTSLFYALVSRGTPTFAAGDLKLVLKLLQD